MRAPAVGRSHIGLRRHGEERGSFAQHLLEGRHVLSPAARVYLVCARCAPRPMCRCASVESVVFQLFQPPVTSTPTTGFVLRLI